MADPPLVWRDRLVAELAGEAHRSLRLLRAAKVIQEALTESGFTMVIVGGSAVTAYDPDAYTSLDIDLVGTGLRLRLDEVLCGQLGFDQEGRHWFDEALGISVERPGSTLQPPGSEAVTVEVSGVGAIVVIAIEDLVCDRLESWATTGHYDSWAQAVRLSQSTTTDEQRLRNRVDDLKLDQYLRLALWLDRERRDGRGDESEISRYIGKLRTMTAADVIEHILGDRTKHLLEADE